MESLLKRTQWLDVADPEHRLSLSPYGSPLLSNDSSLEERVDGPSSCSGEVQCSCITGPGDQRESKLISNGNYWSGYEVKP